MSPKVRSDVERTTAGYQDESLSGDSGRLTYVRNWKEANLLSEPGKPVYPRSPACNRAIWTHSGGLSLCLSSRNWVNCVAALYLK